MNIFIPLLVLLLLVGRTTPAVCKSATLYSDGSVIELDATASKGVLVIPLPVTLIENTLRIKPSGGTVIQQVDILTTIPDTGNAEKELTVLLEQRSRMDDRLQALATREEIFRSAAKTQSGKAPRKTKTNPDPMQSIRQGTEFAIAQLEAVYTARRKAEQEIKRLDSRIGVLRKKTPMGSGRIARVHLSPARGKVTVRYAVAGPSWTPRYDIHCNGDQSVDLYLSAVIDGTFAGYLLQASPSLMSEQGASRVFPVLGGSAGKMASYHLPILDEHFGKNIQSSFSFVMKNTEPVYLPAGEASLYKNGEYIAQFRFEGLSSGRSRTISMGM